MIKFRSMNLNQNLVSAILQKKKLFSFSDLDIMISAIQFKT